MKLEAGARSNSYFTARRITTIAILGAISIVMSVIPFIGYVQVGVIRATFMHIPVIIAGIVEGPLAGAIVGFIFGVTSLVTNMGTIMAPIFINPLVSVLPRVLIGVVSAYVYRSARSAWAGGNNRLAGRGAAFLNGSAVPLAAALGSATNTIGVLSMIYLVAAPQFIKAKGLAMADLLKVLLITVGTNGVAEAVVAVVLVTSVVKAVEKVRR